MGVLYEFYEKYYKVFLYGDATAQLAMGITIVVIDIVGSILVLVYAALPFIGFVAPRFYAHDSEAAAVSRIIALCTHGMLFSQILVAWVPLRGEPDLFCFISRGAIWASKKLPHSCFTSILLGCAQGTCANLWMWHLMFQIGLRCLPEIHLIILILSVGAIASWGFLGVMNGSTSLTLAGYIIYLCWQTGLCARLCFCAPLKPSVKDIEFRDGLKLDIYSSGASPPRRLLLWVHGGGWVFGERGTPNAFVKALVQNHGWIVCSADYRSCHANTDVRLQQQLDDIKGAADWVRSHQHEFGAGDLQLCLGGISAGAHLAALASKDISPAALVFSSGIFRTSREDFGHRPTILGLFEKHIIGSGDPEAWKRASPINLADQSSSFPPTAILHGSADSLSPVTDSRVFSAAARETMKDANRVLYIEVANGPHGWDYFVSSTSRKNAAVVDDFIASFVN